MGLDAGAVLSFSRNDSIMSSLSHSSTEAEIKAVDELMREMIHLLDVSRFCAGTQELPMKLYCDNQSAAALFETLKCSNKVKHINMRINFIRESILEGLFSIHFVPTHYNVADVLTKALHVAQFTHLWSILMLGHGGKEPAWTSDPAAATFKDQLHLALTAHSIVRQD